MNWPKHVNVCGIPYRLVFTDSMIETDVNRYQALWGQCDEHERTIRVFRGRRKRRRSNADMLCTLLHEFGHAILGASPALRRMAAKGKWTDEDFIDEYAQRMADTLIRNQLVRVETHR